MTSTPVFAVAFAGSFISVSVLARLVFCSPAGPRHPKTGLPLDPRGGTYVKNAIARGMAFVAQIKERAKGSTPHATLEAFHKPEDHAFFNESYYFNGCDAATRDRVVTRISRRSNLGARSYVFLLIDSKEHGVLSLEADIPAERASNPTALGLTYECLEPMRRWRIRYTGPMFRGSVHPKDDNSTAARAHVALDLEYVADTDEFWYMRDDHPACLAGNLAQEPWGMDFLRVCLKRTVDHAHYEDFGRMRGSIAVDGSTRRGYDFGTFRDHSWDIRRWATMDNLFILLIALEEPLVLAGGHEYWYLDLTLVDMPGNVGGVARYSTGYALGKRGTPRLALTAGTSIRDIAAAPVRNARGERLPAAEHDVWMELDAHPRDKTGALEACAVRVVMKGDVRRAIYWPDEGAFVVYEDCLEFVCTDARSGRTVQGYGTRQSGFRVGAFDPSLGGCG